MNELLVRHKINIPFLDVYSVSGLTFKQWLPEESIDIKIDDDISVKIWFDLSNTKHLGPIEIEKHINILVDSAYVDVYFKIHETNIIDILMGKTKAINEDITKVQEISDRIYSVAIEKLNRLIDWTYIKKQQFWIQNINFEPERILNFNISTSAKGIILPIDDNKWFIWNPIKKDTIRVKIPDENSYIQKEDWKDLTNYVQNNKRIGFKNELISNALTLNSLTLNRNAIIEANIALEIAISEYVKSPKIDAKDTEYFFSRIGVDNLSKARERLGFSGFVNNLLPLILSNSIFSNDDFKIISDAIQLRNNIVHTGQKNVDNDKCNLSIVTINKLINILDVLTITSC